jgi:hypothetical protein
MRRTLRSVVRRPLTAAVLTTAVLAVAATPALAASTPTTTAGVTRTIEVQTDPINAPGQSMSLQRVVIQPHTTLVEHFHQGTQMARVIEGTLELNVVSGEVQVTGRSGNLRTFTGPTRVTLRRGDQLVELPPVVHYGENTTGKRVVLAVAALIQIGAPLATPTQPASASITLATEIRSEQQILTTLPGANTYGWNHLVGTATLDGQPVLCDMLGNVNYVSGAGPFFGFVTFTFADGSQIATQMNGKAIPHADGSSDVVAELSIFNGTGRFAGQVGSGTFAGHRSTTVGAPVESVFVLSPVAAPPTTTTTTAR